MAEKKVDVKVVADVEDAEVQALEQTIENIENKTVNVEVNVEDGELDSSREKEEDLNDTANVDVNVEDGELNSTESKIEELDGTTIDVNVNNISAMEALDQIGAGFDRLKQGASEIGAQLGTVLEAAGKQETNKTFLEMSVGADQAAKSLETINNIVRDLPGDDTALQGLLSSAAAKNASITAEELRGMGTAAADYFSAMSYYGKSSVEAQQDMTNYILAGNTAELERSPILQGHIDKLKEATTVQERSKALQEALNAEGWGGMSMQDTYNNKLETFNGMLERGRYNLGGMLQEGAKWGMDFVMNLDQASGGIVSMGIALAGFASPVTDTVMGLGQMATGMKAIKDLGMIQWLKDLEIATKLSAAATWLQNTALWGMIAPILANPLTWIVLALIALAAALIWAYQNVDWFREMVDNAWKSLQEFGGYIMGVLNGAIQWLSQAFQNFTSQIGLNTNDWKQAVLGFILFLPQLPLKVGELLVNALAKALGFKGNFTQTMRDAASNAVNNFVTWITSLPGRLWEELQKMLDMARDFAMEIANILTGGAAGMVIGWITGSGEHSPGFMYDALVGELQAMANAPGEYLSQLIDAVSEHGYEMANAFSEAVLGMDLETAFATLIAPLIELQTAVQGFADYVLSLGGLIPADVEITGNSVIDTILRVLGFVATLPLQIGMYLMNIVAEAIGFGQNFSQNMIMSAWNAVSGFTSHVMRLPGQLASYLNSAIGHAVSFAGSLPSRLMQAGSNAVSQFTSAVANLPNGFKNELSEIISAATNFVGNIGSILYNAGVNAIQNFLAGLDRHSPGKMQREFRAEITEMGDSVPGDSRKLLSNVKNLGESIVDEFGTPGLQFGFEHTANSELEKAVGSITGTTVNLNLEIGTVDNEDRITEIIERIRRELFWNNITAGRDVDTV